MNQKVSVIGLGVMGQRMLDNMHRYPGFDAVVAWDPQADACERTAAMYPKVRMASTAAEAIEAPDSTVVYIASPPTFHGEHALAGFASGKSVYCEKPLGVDFDDSTALVAAAKASGLPNIVNFSLASASATQEMEARLEAGALGSIVGVDIRIRFSTWPRAWQMAAAGWLSLREEGGFTREVLSHWIYLTERLFGRLELEDHFVRYPDGESGRLAESALHAVLNVKGLNVKGLGVTVAAGSGGVGPDLVEYTIWGSRSSLRVVDWNQLYSSDGNGWRPELTHIADPRETGYERQLANASAATAGRQHTMPDFADALSVQTIIEQLLR